MSSFFYDGTSDMLQKEYIVERTLFVVRFSKDGKEVYIGTPPVLSSIAAQMVCGDVMAPLHWEPSGRQITFLIGETWSHGVGYHVPPHTNAEKALDRLFRRYR